MRLKNRDKKAAGTKKGKITIIHAIRIFMLLVIGVCLVCGFLVDEQEYKSYFFTSAFTATLTVLLSFIPSFINDRTPITLPVALQTIMVVFILLAQFFGEILMFYQRFWWWDVMLHTSSGVLLGITGVLVVVSLNSKGDVIRRMHPGSVMLFAFCFAMACGGVWEIFEYGADRLLGMNMQRSYYVDGFPGEPLFQEEAVKYLNQYVIYFDHLDQNHKGRVLDPGLIDTMEDTIVDAVGGIISVILTYSFMLKKRKRLTSSEADSTLSIIDIIAEVSEDFEVPEVQEITGPENIPEKDPNGERIG